MLLEVIAASLLAGWLIGGRISRLADVKLTGAEFIIAAFIVQALVSRVAAVDQTLGYLFHVGSYLMLLAALSRNEPSAAIGLMAAGVFLNFVVISLNGGMPVSVAVPVTFDDSIHIRLTDNTLLPWLGDVITWPLPGPLRGLASIGDILLSAGVAALIIQGMRYTGRRIRREEATARRN